MLFINSLPRECCRALLEDWVTTDNGVKPKTWRNLIEVLSEMEELEPVIEEIKQGLMSEGVTFNGMCVVYVCTYSAGNMTILYRTAYIIYYRVSKKGKTIILLNISL